MDFGETMNADLRWGSRLAPNGRTVYFTGATKIWRLALGSWVPTGAPSTPGSRTNRQ